MSEKIIIENFGGIKKASIKLNRINIFIGPQASGKSVVAKLVYFFRTSIGNLIKAGIKSKTLNQVYQEELQRLEEYFPMNNLGTDDFNLKYLIGKESIIVKRQQNKLDIIYSKKITNLLPIAKELYQKSKKDYHLKSSYIFLEETYQYFKKEFSPSTGYRSAFIPTGRSFFAQIETAIFSLMQNDIPIDTFLMDFGAAYENVRHRQVSSTTDSSIAKHIDKLTLSILKGKHLRENKKDYIIHKNGRKVEAKHLSSGQQETLPLLLFLKSMVHNDSPVDMESMTFIEEPESSIFPESQLQIVKLIATVFNTAKNPEHFLITTHSPYILTAFNNLIQAGLMIEEGIDKKKIHKIVPEFEILKSGTVSAFLMKNGKVKNIMDKESGLIVADLIDEVSEDISLEFSNLLDLY